MNDIPLNQLPPNAMQLQRSELQQRPPPDDHKINSSELIFTISPFNTIMTKHIRISCQSKTFGLVLKTDKINQRTHVDKITPNSSVGKSLNYSRHSKNKRRQLNGSCITAANGNPVFDQTSILNEFEKICKAIANGSIETFAIDIAPIPKTSRKTVWKECDEHNIFIPDP